MYFEFAVTSNDRGRSVASILRKHTTLSGKRCLDLGCAYGGFLVAFAEQGSQVVGIDYDQVLLGLARHNLSDNSLDAPLLLRDATRSSDLQEFRNGFDIVTCNDVIEHVDDPLALVLNVADTMREGATAYFEIPNRYYPSFVTSDGHYQLFGITLLDYEEANEYYGYSAPGVAYAVRHYLTIDQYIELFERAKRPAST
jgi:2-polyprenyl-3-methyl-5-hydroxy-6-metoxy-1,4-benzoquinol methylase